MASGCEMTAPVLMVFSMPKYLFAKLEYAKRGERDIKASLVPYPLKNRGVLHRNLHPPTVIQLELCNSLQT
jgi:hypothetical protein